MSQHERSIRKIRSDGEFPMFNVPSSPEFLTPVRTNELTLQPRPRVGVRRRPSEESLDPLQYNEVSDAARNYLVESVELSEKPRKVRRIRSDISQDVSVLKKELLTVGQQWGELENWTSFQKNRTIQNLSKKEQCHQQIPSSPISSPHSSSSFSGSEEKRWCRQCGITEDVSSYGVLFVSGPQGPETLCHCCGWLFNHKINKQQQFFTLYSQVFFHNQ